MARIGRGYGSIAKAWRVSTYGLEVRVESENEWGPANNAKNILVRPAPDASSNTIEVSVTFKSNPTNQYEQACLVWFYDEANMVKIGREMVDGIPSIVMGREENDKTKTIIIIPLEAVAVQLLLSVKGNRIEGRYRECDCDDWDVAGHCDLPAKGSANISLQFYNGPTNAEHWVN